MVNPSFFKRRPLGELDVQVSLAEVQLALDDKKPLRALSHLNTARTIIGQLKLSAERLQELEDIMEELTDNINQLADSLFKNKEVLEANIREFK